MTATERPMRLGLILHADTSNGQDQAQQIAALLHTINAAENAGLSTVWLTEQHHQAHSPTPRPELLIAHAAANTQRIEFGTAALTFGQRSALEIAEIASSLALLAPGRIRLGVARGKFPPRRLSPSPTGLDSLVDPLDELAAWLSAQPVIHEEHTAPKPLVPAPPARGSLPIYLATRQTSRAARAAQHGFGLMIGQFWPSASIHELLSEYRRHNPTPPALMMSRGYCPIPNKADATAQTMIHIETVRARKTAPQGVPAGQRPIDRVTRDSVADFVLMGDESTQYAALQQLAALGVTDLALNLMTDDPAEQAEWLEALGQLNRRWLAQSA